HGFEPGLPSLSYLALRDSAALTVATFFSPERLSYPPGKAQRERLLGRVDALLATSAETAAAAAVRFPGRYERVPTGVDLEQHAPGDKQKVVVLEWRQLERPLLRALAGELRALPEWIVADLHLHTSWSHDCSIEVDDLLDHAEAEGLGAIAVTDHNVFGGALEAAERARGRRLLVIPGEEIKTDEQGEVIGLFLHEEIPRGLSFAETVGAIHAQGGLVYVPHPFDRVHTIPGAATLHRHLAD